MRTYFSDGSQRVPIGDRDESGAVHKGLLCWAKKKFKVKKNGGAREKGE